MAIIKNILLRKSGLKENSFIVTVYGGFLSKSFGNCGVMVIKCENLQLHSRGLSYILLKCIYRGYLCVTLFRIPGYMAHNVFVNEHIVMLADSFTRKRAMHINITKVIFSVGNTPFSLCFFITLTLASPEMII